MPFDLATAQPVYDTEDTEEPDQAPAPVAAPVAPPRKRFDLSTARPVTPTAPPAPVVPRVTPPAPPAPQPGLLSRISQGASQFIGDQVDSFRDRYNNSEVGTSQYIGDYIDRLKAADAQRQAVQGESFNLGDGVTRLAGQGEAVAQLGTGLASIPLAIVRSQAGITGDLSGTVDPTTGATETPAAEFTRLRNQTTYEPRLPVGKAYSEELGAALSPVSDLFHAAGGALGDAFDYFGADPRKSDYVRTVAPDLLNFVPLGLPRRGAAELPPLELPRDAPAPAPAPAPPPGAVPPPAPPVPPRQPTNVGELRADAQAAYARAEQAGVVITPQSFAGAQQRIAQSLAREGIDPTLHPATTAALARVTQEPGPITLERAETLRRIANDATTTQNPADRRLAGQLVDQIDDYMEGLQPADVSAGDPAAAVNSLIEARDLWSRLRKTQIVEELVSRAELSAPNFSGSGVENALRIEFKQLGKNARRMRQFSPAEQAAIRRVATGGSLVSAANILRYVGKLAPTGLLSSVLSGTAGYGLGGPLGAIGLPALGLAARTGATRATEANVERVRQLTLRGRGVRTVPPGQAPPVGAPTPAPGQGAPAPGPIPPAPTPAPVAPPNAVPPVPAGAPIPPAAPPPAPVPPPRPAPTPTPQPALGDALAGPMPAAAPPSPPSAIPPGGPVLGDVLPSAPPPAPVPLAEPVTEAAETGDALPQGSASDYTPPAEVAPAGRSLADELTDYGRVIDNELLANATRVKGGVTFQPTTGHEPTPYKPGAYSVSPYPEREVILEPDVVTADAVNEFIDNNMDLLERGDHYFGTWHDKKKGKVFLDVSIVEKTVEAAIATGRRHRQIAYFSFEDMQSHDISPELRDDRGSGNGEAEADRRDTPRADNPADGAGQGGNEARESGEDIRATEGPQSDTRGGGGISSAAEAKGQLGELLANPRGNQQPPADSLGEELAPKPPVPGRPPRAEAPAPKPAAEPKQTDSAEFKQWFGDSAVVDEAGKPLRLYHGTGADFDTFKKPTSGKNTSHLLDFGFHFSGPKTASRYAEAAQFGGKHQAGLSRDGAEGNPAIYPVYLKAENIADIRNGMPQALKAAVIELADAVGMSPNSKFIYLADVDPLSLLGRVQQLAGRKKLRDVFKAQGYDGVRYRFGEAGEDSYVVFDPAQIKSATGNSGRFDAASADITDNLGDALSRSGTEAAATAKPPKRLGDEMTDRSAPTPAKPEQWLTLHSRQPVQNLPPEVAFPEKPVNDRLFRGVTSEEFASIQKLGEIRSTGAYSDKSEGTSFSDDPQVARSYATFGRDDPAKTGKPVYVVELSAGPDIALDRRDYYHKSTLGEDGSRTAIPADRITRTWQMNPDGSTELVPPKPAPAEVPKPTLQTDTPEFKRFFRESKAVDEDGKPLKLFHGTRADFGSFDRGKLGAATGANSATKGFFFSNRPQTAESYTNLVLPEEKAAHDALFDEGQKLRKSAFRSRSPDREKRLARMNKLAREGDALLSQAAEMRKQGGNVMPVYLSLKNPLVHDMKGKNYRDQSYSDLVDKAIAAGHDGLIIKNTYDAVLGDGIADDVYVVFDPKQIKSAIGNAGKFDPNVDDITGRDDSKQRRSKSLADELIDGDPDRDRLA